MLKPRRLRLARQRLISLFAALALFSGLLFASLSPVFAIGAFTSRSATLSTSLAGATGVTYTLGFTTATTNTIQSFSAQACDTASGSCTQSGAASGFSASSSTFTSSTITGSWTVNTATASTLKATVSSGSASTNSGVAKNIVFGGVANPSAANSTFYLRFTTYSDTSYTTPIDQGTVAVSTAGQITVTASIDESLAFTLTAATVGLGSLSQSSTKSGTSTMTAATNATHGYVITVNGSTLSGPSTITALTSPTASSTGTPQFGINLKGNATPSVGSDPSGGSGAAATGYNTANSYKFVSGDTIASASGASNTTTYTVSYIANIDYTDAAGSYTTTLTYICTPTF